MPYIAVKSYPKDDEVKKRVAEKIKNVFLEEWGCPPEAISISWDEVKPEDWANVEENEIKPNAEKLFILNGKAVK